jgi:hypothetical protein
MFWIIVAGSLLCLSIPAYVWIQHRRRVHSRQRPLSLDLVTAPNQIRHNFRRSSTPSS